MRFSRMVADSFECQHGLVHFKIFLLLFILTYLIFGQWIFEFLGVYMCIIYAHCMQKPEVGIECPAVPGSALLLGSWFVTEAGARLLARKLK